MLARMSMMIEELYDALKEAGATEETAKRAARAIADYESRFNGIESTQRLHTTLLTLIISGTIALILKAFFV